MQFIKIESKENNLVKKVVKLLKSSTYRHDNWNAVIYGEHLVIEANKYLLLESVILNESAIDKYKKILNIIEINNKKQIIQRRAKIYITDDEIFDKMNMLDGKVDLVGVIKFRHPERYVLNKLAMSGFDNDVILLENIQDPGNLGAILRIAAASGIKNICLSKTCVDVYNPKVLRSSQGLQFGLNIYTDVDLLEFVRHYPGQIIATLPLADKSIYNVDLNSYKTAFIFGNEGEGVSKELLKLVKTKVKIPMADEVESLNVAMAATVCAFEMVRQRLC